MRTFLDFEKPIAELEGKIAELRHISSTTDVNIAEEVGRLQGKLEGLLKQTYSRLTPWQKAQVARHVDRPHALDYIRRLATEFTPFAGDRLFGEDAAMIGGIGRLRGRACVILGQEKGSDTDSRLKHNFGMPRPEGYRKAQRLMRLADHFGLPVITLVDTPGAYPGVDAEARGQAEAIARCIETCLAISVPLIAVVIGEGGIRRRAGARHSQPGNDAGARHLFRDLARGLRLDPLARRRTGASGGAGAAADREGSAESRRDRRDHTGATGRRASNA